jgi:uncharacterized protein YkuJ
MRGRTTGFRSAAAGSSASSSAAAQPAQASTLFDSLHAFEMRARALAQTEFDLHEHFLQAGGVDDALPPELNPVLLLQRLHALQSEGVAHAQERRRFEEEREGVLAEVERLMSENQALMRDMTAQLTTSQSPAEAESRSPLSAMAGLTIDTARASSARPASARPNAGGPTTPVGRKVARPATASARSPTAASAASAASAAANHDGGLFGDARPLDGGVGPLTAREFNAISVTVRGRSKLDECNHMLGVITVFFTKYVTVHRVREGGTLPPLTLQQLSELQTVIKIGGASSQSIIGTLRACKRITATTKGISLVKPPVFGQK